MAVYVHEPDPSFGGLAQPGETPAAAIARLERRRDFVRLMETDNGQRLLQAAARSAARARAQAAASLPAQ